MSIVGTQSVSLSDLMQLGIPALNAMAQGQQSSIAPSYMVISALKALTDQQKGMGVPAPQGTVKDQVVAAAQPAAQPGIMGLQGMAGGGQVQSFSSGGATGKWDDTPTQAESDRDAVARMLKMTGARAADLGLLIPRGLASGYNSTVVRAMRAAGLPAGNIPDVADGDFSSTTPFYDKYFRTAETAPTVADPLANTTPAPAGLSENRAPPAGQPAPPQQGPTSESGKVRVSNSSRVGIGQAGANPIAGYREMNTKALTPKQLSEIAELNIPVDEYLKQQREKYSAPDEKRLAELNDAEERAGLSAFARGMLNTKNGTGFGAVFGNAAADYSDTKAARADKRREYEDRREDVARQLALASGQEQRERFAAQQKYKEGERQFDLGIQTGNRAMENAGVKEFNDVTTEKAKIDVERQKVAMMAAAQSLAAEVRRDGLTEKNQAAIERLYMMAKEVAIKEADSLHGKIESLDGTINPLKAAAKQRTLKIAFNQEVARLNSMFGRGGAAPSAAPGTVRGTFGQ